MRHTLLTEVHEGAVGSASVIDHRDQRKQPDTEDEIGAGVVPQAVRVHVDAASQLRRVLNIKTDPRRNYLH